MTTFLWIGLVASFLPRRWFKTRDARRWRSGRHWRKTSGGAADSLGYTLPGSPTAPALPDPTTDAGLGAVERTAQPGAIQDGTDD